MKHEGTHPYGRASQKVPFTTWRTGPHGLACLPYRHCLAGIVGGLALLLFWSYPGRPKPFVDDNGTPLPRSLAEKIFIDVNGVTRVDRR